MEPTITVMHGLSGFFAVLMVWQHLEGSMDESDGFWEPAESHHMRRQTREVAVVDAQVWAQTDGHNIDVS